MSQSKANRTPAIGGGYAHGIEGIRGWVRQDDEPGTATAPPATPQTSATDQIVERLSGTLDDRLAPIESRLDAVEATTTELAKPRTKASLLFGSNVRTGEDPLTSRGYSYVRAFSAMQGSKGPIPEDQCKVEFAIHEKLQKHMSDEGRQSAEANTLKVPFGVRRHMAGDDQSLAQEIHECVMQGVEGADVGEMRAIARDARRQATLARFDDSAAGELISPATQGELIELVRAREVFTRAGAREMSLPPNGSINFPKHTGASEFFWVGETQAVTESNPTTSHLQLTAKRGGVLVKVGNMLIRFGSPSVEAFVREDMARQIALGFDLAQLQQAGSAIAPKGIINYANINDLTGGASVVTTDTNGDTIIPVGPGNMIAEVETENFETEGASFVMRPKMWRSIMNSRADAVSTGDGAGPFLFSVNREDIRNGMPATLEGRDVITSTQVSNTRVKGSGVDLTYILFGLFSEWITARAGVIEFALSTENVTAFTQDETWVRALIHADAGPRHEEAFCLVDDLIEVV